MTVTDLPRLPGPALPSVQGFCPVGCGRTLALDASGAVTCTLLTCPRPLAVFELLQDAETEHVVVVRGKSYTLQHPLHERLGQALMSCALQRWMVEQTGDLLVPGRYRAFLHEDGSFEWEALPAAAPAASLTPRRPS